MTVTKSIQKYGTRYYMEIDGLQVKVPFRYGRAETISGLKTVWEFKSGDSCLALIDDGRCDVKILREICEN